MIRSRDAKLSRKTALISIGHPLASKTNDGSENIDKTDEDLATLLSKKLARDIDFWISCEVLERVAVARVLGAT